MKILLLLFVFCAACATSNLPTRGEESPILHIPRETASSEKLVIFVPGALNSVGMFGPALEWREQGYALAFFRFPGFDGLAADHRLDIEEAGRVIAEFANEQRARHIRLVGYSTGGPVVLEAAKHIAKPDLKVAGLSSAVPFPTSVSTALRGANNLGRVVSKLGTFNKDRIWKQYYQVLLYGEAGLERPELKAVIKETTERELKNVKVPPNDLIANHTADLRFWRLREAEKLRDVEVRFFHGLEDPVFSTAQTQTLAEQLPNAEIAGYKGQGHILFLTAPRVFGDMLAWFDS